MPLYFAYGSNMDRDAMALRCPASRSLGVARLPRHRLVIMREGYVSVTRDPRRTVWGMLWDLALADVPALDRYESVAARLYTKLQQSVLAEAGARRALVYVGRNAGPGAPRPGYMEGVIAAAQQAGIPPAYLSELGAMSPRTGFHVGASSAPPRQVAAVTPRRTSPLEAEPNRQAGWSWTP